MNDAEEVIEVPEEEIAKIVQFKPVHILREK